MSVTVMALAWYVGQLTPSQKIVLLAMADHANDEGRHVYPSVNRLVFKTSLSERTVRRALSDLRKTKLIHVVKKSTRRLPTEYKLDLPQMQVRQFRPATSTTSDLPEVPIRPARDAPKPSVNHHKEPSEDGGNDNLDESLPSVISYYEQNIALITQAVSEPMQAAVDEFGAEWVQDAIKIAAQNNIRKWTYIDGILGRWRASGRNDKPQQQEVKRVGDGYYV